MPIVQIIVVLVVVGLLLWLVNQFIPMDDRIRTILNVVVVIAVVFWIIGLFIPGLWNVRIGH